MRTIKGGGKLMKKITVKQILIVSLILNALLMFFSYSQYKDKDSVKRDIIIMYLSNQHNIKDDLSNVLKGKENRETVINSLTQAKGCFMENINYLGNANVLANQTALAKVEEAYLFNRKGYSIVNQAILSETNGNLTQQDICDIEEYLSNVDSYIKQLNINFDTAKKGSSRDLVNKIRDSIRKIQY